MSQRKILKFWLPLLGSWLLMTFEGPFISALVNRLPDPKTMLAAQGIVIGLSVLIESPIINMLSTSTAKVSDHASYRLVRRFTIHWSILLTILTLLIAYTPLFDLIVIQGMGVTPEISAPVRTGMRLMIFWSAAIAWRRFLQGVLIKFGRTRAVAIGTAVRLTCAIAVALLVAVFTDASGIVMAAATWMTGVVTEAIYTTYAVRPLFEKELAVSPSETAGLSYADLFWFHLPLAGTSVLALLLQPLAVYALARLPNPTDTLAAWPVLFQILLIARAPALALPEAIIALNKTPETTKALRRFTLTIAAGIAIALTVFYFTPAHDFYLNRIQQTLPEITALVRQGVALTLLFPALTVLIFGLRGFLISQQQTKPITVGMAINLVTTAIVLFLGVRLQWAGITTAALSLTASAITELLYLTQHALTIQQMSVQQITISQEN